MNEEPAFQERHATGIKQGRHEQGAKVQAGSDCAGCTVRGPRTAHQAIRSRSSSRNQDARAISPSDPCSDHHHKLFRRHSKSPCLTGKSKLVLSSSVTNNDHGPGRIIFKRVGEMLSYLSRVAKTVLFGNFIAQLCFLRSEKQTQRLLRVA